MEMTSQERLFFNYSSKKMKGHQETTNNMGLPNIMTISCAKSKPVQAFCLRCVVDLFTSVLQPRCVGCLHLLNS